MTRDQRRLAAIVSTDVVGYSVLMGRDDSGTLAQIRVHRQELIDAKIAEYGGRIVKTTGDGLLLEFPSVVDAVQCAVDVQRGMAKRNAGVPSEARIDLRVGINVGEVIIENDDIFGDGVNVAARLQELAEPGGICVSGRVYEDAHSKLDIAFQDTAERQLKNIARPVRVYRILLGEGGNRPELATAISTKPLALPDRPSIAVLPFQNISGDPEQEYFADGMVEELVTALSRIRWLFVIARNSSLTYKGLVVDVKRVGRELGVRYLLEGAVRRVGQRVRISAQLIEATTGAHLWADRFDGSLEDVFDLQNQVAISVAGVIEPTLQAAEIRRSTARPTDDLTAYDLYLRASAHLRSLQKDATFLALDLFGEAVKRDPQYGSALALAARCHAHICASGWTDDTESHRRDGVDLARRALAAGTDDPVVLCNAGFVLADFGEDIDAAMVLIDHALALNPSYASGWTASGFVRLWAGQLESAIDHFETALRLSPRADRAAPYVGIGMANFFARRFEDAKTMLLRALQERPTWAPTYRYIASCYAHMGLLEEARDAVRQLRDITPFVVPSVNPLRNREYREFFLSGLRLASGKGIGLH
jgi:TolB-like protein/class 3 adenylate cyclase/Tfp pilus assembly protein PilF